MTDAEDVLMALNFFPKLICMFFQYLCLCFFGCLHENGAKIEQIFLSGWVRSHAVCKKFSWDNPLQTVLLLLLGKIALPKTFFYFTKSQCIMTVGIYHVKEECYKKEHTVVAFQCLYLLHTMGQGGSLDDIFDSNFENTF